MAAQPASETQHHLNEQIPAVSELLNYSGKTVVVTGASAGIGAGIVRRFHEAGANVVAHYRSDAAGAQSLTATLGSRAVAVYGDITIDADVERLMQSAVDSFGSLDVLVNNAALQPHAAFLDLSGDDFDLVMQANVGGMFRCSKVAAGHMSGKHGAIVNISSISGLEPAFTSAHYCSSKAAVIMLTRVAALELGPLGVRVNAVAPGLIWRDGLDKNWPEGLARWLAHVPLGTVGRNEDVADACLFLGSRAARWITGTTLTVDGGVTTHPSY